MCRRTLPRLELDRGLAWIDAFRRHAKPRSFTRSAGLHRAAVPATYLRRIDGAAPTALAARYSFPPALASPSSGSSTSIDLSAVLAVFDEVSSWSFFDADRTHRPGVSVHLSAVAHWSTSPAATSNGGAKNGTPVRPPEVGEPLDVVVSAPQCGRNLGFVSVELRRGNSVLAAGKHVKSLPMPGLGPGKRIPWDFVFAPMLGDLPIQLLHKLEQQVDTSKVGEMDDSASKWFAGLRGMPTNEAMQPLHNVDENRAIYEAALVTSEAQLNGVGTTHGGFQAMLAEAGVRWAREQRANASTTSAVNSRTLRALSVNYLSAHRRGPLHVQATLPSLAQASSQLNLGASNGTAVEGLGTFGETAEVVLYDPRNARRTSEATLHYF